MCAWQEAGEVGWDVLTERTADSLRPSQLCLCAVEEMQLESWFPCGRSPPASFGRDHLSLLGRKEKRLDVGVFVGGHLSRLLSPACPGWSVGQTGAGFREGL